MKPTKDCCPGIIHPACQGEIGLQLHRRGRKDCTEARGFSGAPLSTSMSTPKLVNTYCNQKRQDHCGFRPSGMNILNTLPIKNPNQLREGEHEREGQQEKSTVSTRALWLTIYRKTDYSHCAHLPSCLCVYQLRALLTGALSQLPAERRTGHDVHPVIWPAAK